MYGGILLALTGLAIYLAHPLPFLLLLAFVAYMNRFQISPEERVLTAKFGNEYEHTSRAYEDDCEASSLAQPIV